MHRRRAWLPISALLLLPGCGEFKQHQVLKIAEGAYATVGIPPTEDAFTICLDDRPLKTCSRSEAIFYSYRSTDVSFHVAEDTLLVRLKGGEIRKGPPGEPVDVGDRQIKVRIEHTP